MDKFDNLNSIETWDLLPMLNYTQSLSSIWKVSWNMKFSYRIWEVSEKHEIWKRLFWEENIRSAHAVTTKKKKKKRRLEGLLFVSLFGSLFSLSLGPSLSLFLSLWRLMDIQTREMLNELAEKAGFDHNLLEPNQRSHREQKDKERKIQKVSTLERSGSFMKGGEKCRSSIKAQHCLQEQ